MMGISSKSDSVQNPVKAGIVSRASDYEFISDQYPCPVPSS